eukprot:4046044-Prymnesium_polylepis.1
MSDRCGQRGSSTRARAQRAADLRGRHCASILHESLRSPFLALAGEEGSALSPDGFDPLADERIGDRLGDYILLREDVRSGGRARCRRLLLLECVDQVFGDIVLRLPRVLRLVVAAPLAQVFDLSAALALAQDGLDLVGVRSLLPERRQLVAGGRDPLVESPSEAVEVHLDLASIVLAALTDDLGLVPCADAIARLQPRAQGEVQRHHRRVGGGRARKSHKSLLCVFALDDPTQWGGEFDHLATTGGEGVVSLP